MTHESNQPDSKLHGSLRGRARAVVSKASTLSRLSRADSPLSLCLLRGLSATGRGFCGGSLRRNSCKVHCPHLMAKRASASPPKRRTIYDTFIPPDGRKKNNCCTIAVSAERRDQCQVRFPLAIPRTPRHPERRTTPLQAAEPMVGQRVRRDHRTCGSRTG